ncbi:MAG TPA: thrombospondin type 3 repeat-containing protein [Solirubrobacteraceae bacterium]|jgi:hypothetical protein
MPRIRWALVAVLGGLVALPATASAVPAPEPNDGIHQAKGPLQANVTYNGSIAAPYEDDWFIVHLSGPGTLKVDVTNSTVNCYYGLRTRIHDADGYELKDDTVSQGNAGSQTQIANAAGTYYFRLSGTGSSNCSGNYGFKATGPLTGGPLPGPAQATANTGRTAASAIGPLAGGTPYAGRIDSGGEDDWFFFYTNGGGEFDVVVTNTVTNDPYDYGCSLYAQLYSGASDDYILLGQTAYTNTHTHLRYNGAAAAHYSIRIDNSSCADDDYRLRIDPAGRVTDQEPPPPPPTDTDGDGVPDDLDRCDEVPAGTADGCPPPPDADGDGVPDASDRCPRAPASTSDGCAPPPPPDRDRDGVPDATDRCPGTAAATPTGCAAAPAVTAACSAARARRSRAKAALATAKVRARTARSAAARRRWRRIRASRRAVYARSIAAARRACA